MTVGDLRDALEPFDDQVEIRIVVTDDGVDFQIVDDTMEPFQVQMVNIKRTRRFDGH